MHSTQRSLLTLAVAIGLTLTACGSERAVAVTIQADTGVERLDDLSTLRTRVFTVEEVTEPFATATSAAGTPIEGISCDVIAQLSADAADCEESERTVLRDRDLVLEGTVPASGQLELQIPDEDVRLYVELPASAQRIDQLGRICNWTAAEVIDASQSEVVVQMRALC